MLPALGGKLKTTNATLRCPRSLRRSVTSRSTRAASICARSGQVAMSCCTLRMPPGAASGAESWPVKVQRWSQPVQVTPGPPGRPPKTVGLVAPSSSGMATMMVLSTGSRPRSEPPHWSRVWNSTGCAAT